MIVRLDEDRLTWWCPGCDATHTVPVNVTGGWEFNRDSGIPSLTPSVLVHARRALINEDLQEPALTNEANVRWTPRCHSSIRHGHIQFLTDSTHYLAGQTVPMGPVPGGN